MANLLHGSRLRSFGIHNLGGRNYDYTEMYSPDKLGEEARENARVWNVYLDEAESHDADMIEGYRSIIESLLVFAALFSAVVTTFVAQTSQALQPDNSQIMASLLVETNQLLRAAGNRTNIDAVPPASLGPESRTYTSIDVWVNGLFFTSLALSLSTALLSVLAKQWIQAYTAVVPGGAKTRAFIRQFRFDGLVKWKLGEIIESLPLILHSSVAVFLVGLALYVSQLSRPICGIVSAITALTFLFYFASSMLPAFYIACPYRIPFIFPLAQLLSFAFRMTRWSCLCLWDVLTNTKFNRVLLLLRPGWMPIQPLKKAEHDAVLEQSFFGDRLAHDSLGWVFNHSSNRFVKEVVIEGTCGLLNERSSFEERFPHRLTSEYLNPSSGNSYLSSAILYSLSRLSDTYSASSLEDEIGKNKHGTLYGSTPLVIAFHKLYDSDTNQSSDNSHMMVTFLLDHGAHSSSHDELYDALKGSGSYVDLEKVKLLLDYGWERTLKDAKGETLLEFSHSKGNDILVEYLEHYQTVRLAPYGMTSSTANEETT